MKNSTLIITATLASSLFVSTFAIGDDDSRSRWGGSSLDVAPVTNTLYKSECGDCHMAYQPGFLPARSWKKLMTTLDQHFDENAEVDADTQKQLTQYLVDNSAETSNYKRSKAMMRSLSAKQTPLRISETRYFLRKHDELSDQYVKDNPEVKTFSRCEVCHTDANKGSYDENQVRIPGFERWED